MTQIISKNLFSIWPSNSNLSKFVLMILIQKWFKCILIWRQFYQCSKILKRFVFNWFEHKQRNRSKFKHFFCRFWYNSTELCKTLLQTFYKTFFINKKLFNDWKTITKIKYWYHEYWIYNSNTSRFMNITSW